VLQSVLFKEGEMSGGQLLFQIDRAREASLKQRRRNLPGPGPAENSRVQQERLEPCSSANSSRVRNTMWPSPRSNLWRRRWRDRALVEQARIQLEFSRIHARSPAAPAPAIKPGNLVPRGRRCRWYYQQHSPILVTFSVPERQLDEIRPAERTGDADRDPG